MDKSGIYVAEYLTELPPKVIFMTKLQDAAIKAKIQVEQRWYNSRLILLYTAGKSNQQEESVFKSRL